MAFILKHMVLWMEQDVARLHGGHRQQRAPCQQRPFYRFTVCHLTEFTAKGSSTREVTKHELSFTNNLSMLALLVSEWGLKHPVSEQTWPTFTEYPPDIVALYQSYVGGGAALIQIKQQSGEKRFAVSCWQHPCIIY